MQIANIRIGVALCSLIVCAAGHAQITNAPPRNVEDILTVLEQYKPDPDELQRIRVRLSEEPPANARSSELARFYRVRGQLAFSVGLLSQGINDSQLAAEHVQKGGDEEITAIQRLGGAEQNAGNPLKAVMHWETALNRNPGNNPQINVRAQVARAYVELGDFETAKKFLENANRLTLARERARERGQRKDLMTVDFNRSSVEAATATLLAATGKLAEAEMAMRRAIAGHKLAVPVNQARFEQGRINGTNLPEAFEIRESRLENRLAEILALQGKLSEAELVARQVLQQYLQRGGRYSANVADALVTLARIVVERGRYADAIALSKSAIDIYRRVGAPPESLFLAEAQKLLGRTLVVQDQWPEAVKVFEEMYEGIKKDPLLAQKLGTGDIDWGLALVRTGQPARAVAMLDELAQRHSSRVGENNGQVAEIRGHLGIALAAVGERDRALTEFRRALPILLGRAYAELASEEGGIARTARLTRVLEAYLDLLAESAAGSVEAAAEAFRIADIARGSQVQRALSASAARAAIADPRLAELAREEQDAATRLGVLTSLLSRLLAAPPDQQLPKVIAGIRQEIETLRATRVKQKQDLERRFPDYANLIDPKPVTLQQARAALRPGEALISVYVGTGKTYVWAVPQQGAASFAAVPLGDKAIAESVQLLRKALDVGNAAIARFPRFDTTVAHRLFNDLLKPVEAGWKEANSLVIVPHRALGQLPFSLLVTAPAEPGTDTARFDGYRAVPWLLRKAAITQLPSVNALSTLRALPAVTASRREFIGFGDPYFSKAQHAAAAREERIQVAELAANLRNLKIDSVALPMAGEAPDPAEGTLRAPTVANSATLAQLSRLPDTADEIRDIAQVLKADMSRDVFLGVNANEKNVKTTNMADRKIVAFATHGLVPGDLNGLEQPALALTAPDVAGIDGDGLLTMDEILNLKLNADWVVLSACNTGSADGAGSEAVSGLGRAFFYAGARSLLVSNWPVETDSARLLTTDVFKRSAANPALTRAEALRQTMLWLMDNAGQKDASGKFEFTYAHPMFWAPFALIGDGGK